MKETSIIPLLKLADTTLPFNIQSIKELAEQADHSVIRVHSHDHYQVIWLMNGKGTLFVDLQKHTVENNTIFFLKPNQAHRVELDTQMEGYVFSFSDAFFNLGD